MRHLLRLVDPESWTWRFYLGVFLALLSLNFFSPRGLVHRILIEQEISRLEVMAANLAAEEHKLQTEMELFRKSSWARARAIRGELGYLREDEVSVELLVPSKPSDQQLPSPVAR